MDSLPREILYMVIEYLSIGQYINFAVAYSPANRTVNDYFKNTYNEMIRNNLSRYICCRKRKYICNTCGYVYCHAHDSRCYHCGMSYLCPKCDPSIPDGCLKCIISGIISKNTVWCESCDEFVNYDTDCSSWHNTERRINSQIKLLYSRYPQYSKEIKKLTDKHMIELRKKTPQSIIDIVDNMSDTDRNKLKEYIKYGVW